MARKMTCSKCNINPTMKNQRYCHDCHAKANKKYRDSRVLVKIEDLCNCCRKKLKGA